MKTCRCCKAVKDLSHYVPYKHSPDGFYHLCKHCARLKTKRRWDTYGYRGRGNQYNGKLPTDPDQRVCISPAMFQWLLRQKVVQDAVAENEAREKRFRKELRERTVRKNNVHSRKTGVAYLKWRAQKLVELAFRRGDLVRPATCEACDCECKPHAHHYNYHRPLEVVFLCSKCHREVHRTTPPEVFLRPIEDELTVEVSI